MKSDPLGIVGNISATLLIAIANILIGRFFHDFNGDVVSILSLLLILIFFLSINYREKIRNLHVKISTKTVVLVTVLIIIGFGIAIRMYYEQRLGTNIPIIYDTYRQIYNVLSP